MQKRFRIITLAFILSFITIAALSLYTIKQFISLTEYSRAVDHTNSVITRLQSAKDVLREFDRREREYMILKDSSYLQDHNDRILKLDRTISELRSLIKDDKEQVQNLILLRGAMSLRINYFRQNVAYLDTAGHGNVSEYYRLGNKVNDECYTYINRMLDRERALLSTSFSQKKEFEYLTMQTTGSLLVIFFLLTLVLFFLMIYELRQKMKYEQALETQLMDLENSHAELEQIAFAASHDMQEPLRKIKIFGDRLLYIRKEAEDSELRMSIDKISQAADEVQDLTKEIINLASLVRSKNFEEHVNIRHIIDRVIDDYRHIVSAKNAGFIISALPSITGDPAQLRLLFEHLISNALKFGQHDTEVKITITGTVVTGSEIEGINRANKEKRYYRIEVKDNGIGFDNIFVSKIFKVFQRLHNDESPYDGKGIGLAICQRIMTNHQGFITASGEINKGASFVLYFPTDYNL